MPTTSRVTINVDLSVALEKLPHCWQASETQLGIAVFGDTLDEAIARLWNTIDTILLDIDAKEGFEYIPYYLAKHKVEFQMSVSEVQPDMVTINDYTADRIWRLREVARSLEPVPTN